MRLSEIYLAHQGEGPSLGIESVFIRLHLCPVQCRWCDTAFTWDGSEQGEPVEPEEVVTRALKVAGRVSHAVITGGEPLVNKGLGRLIEGLLASGPTFGVEVETSGVLAPAKGLPRDARLAWNLSPKMPSAEAKILPDPEILSRWIGEHRARLKIVIADEADWQAMETLLAQLPPEARQSTSVMPQARTREELSETQGWLLNRAMGSGLRVTTRMHVTAFGSKRGT